MKRWLYLNITLAAVWKIDCRGQEWKLRGQLFTMVFYCPEPFEPCCVWHVFILMNSISLIPIPSLSVVTRTPACKLVFWTIGSSNQKHHWRPGFWTEQTCLLAEVLPTVCIFQTVMTDCFPSCFKVVFLIQTWHWRGMAVLVFYTFFGIYGIFWWFLGKPG